VLLNKEADRTFSLSPLAMISESKKVLLNKEADRTFSLSPLAND